MEADSKWEKKTAVMTHGRLEPTMFTVATEILVLMLKLTIS